MAKGNPFLGMARGSAGDFTYYRQYGEQVFRARNRHPSNPRTTLQLLQRVVMLTVQRAYSMLSPIADHAFQGRQKGTMSQARFTELNIAKLRLGLANAIEEISTGQPGTWYGESNYAAKGSFLPEFMPYVISEGSIASLSYEWNAGVMSILLSLPGGLATITYEQLVTALGLQRGDQLTFLLLNIDDTTDTGQFNGLNYARVILDPATDAAWSQAMFTAVPDIEGLYTLANPNTANEGSLYFSAGSGRLNFTMSGNVGSEINSAVNSPAAFSVIVSRRAGDLWQRSSESLVLRPYTVGNGNLDQDHGTDYLGDAVESFITKSGSTLYLNQAENL